jgi:hypothetical protein
MGAANKTHSELTEFRFGLPANSYSIRLVPGDGCSEHRAIPTTYSVAQLISADTSRFLRARNKEGYHVYGRPDANRHILIDDLCEDGLAKLIADDLQPAFVVETSKANFQAWITVARGELPPALATSAAKLLAARYGGDPRSAHEKQLGRLPGLTNRKAKYESGGLYPFAKQRSKPRPRVAPGAGRLIAEAQRLLEANELSPFTLGGGGHHETSMIDITMTPDEGRDIYSEVQDELKVLYPSVTEVRDRSRLDYAIARFLYRRGFTHDEIAEILLHGSEKAAERGFEYAYRTARAAVGV